MVDCLSGNKYMPLFSGLAALAPLGACGTTFPPQAGHYECWHDSSSKEALIKSLSNFILEFLFN
ncbi:hypothetical protein, partial [uncultured Dialister sp.]|uniref:hypothetical protein n=1 Tax=uncultured Dialister sp. TaxID=278064 RepID=UPI00265AF963